ncbi:hypothetical protein [Marinobacterium arenosum]|uniref:hypothetical protein n=1 Tax=Marinobacterium arenosum TaxID=2862496 RepID=UPI001C93D063|nr:hypothetical protein [Marinobacterium arenosum]MBY4675603.1 hypothetical protein [Marinobacterium arenosum]
MGIRATLQSELEPLIQRALKQGQIESYGSRTRLYKHGIYSNDTSLWSHSPALALNQPGHYLITVQPKQSLNLAILHKADFDRLLQLATHRPEPIQCALNTLCQQLNEMTLPDGVDGFASYRLDPGHHYQHIIVFRPLQVLALYDIEQV